MLAEIQKAAGILTTKLASGAIAGDVAAQTAQLVAKLQARDQAGATAIQSSLSNTAWNEHKDWLKGTKVLIQLVMKKLR